MSEERFAAVEKRLDGNDRRWEDHEKRHAIIDEAIVKVHQVIDEMRLGLREMRAAQDNLATKADLTHAINLVLRDALNSLPARHAVIWAGITALLTLAAIFVGLHH